MTGFGLLGVGGRMGAALTQALCDGRHRIVAACDREGHDAVGRDLGQWAGLEPLGVIIGSDPAAVISAADVTFDFTVPEASCAHARMASELGKALVIGTTGFSPAQDAEIAEATRRAAIVKSGNYSTGLSVMAKLVETLARALPDFDLEILEMHHNRKVDAPSGTALMIGNAAARGRQITLESAAIRNRDGITGRRPPGAIGFQSLRAGTIVGEHSLLAAGPHERIEIRHIAEDRSIFANGAVRAGLWVAGAAPGLYTMDDVLGLNAVSAN